MVLLHLITESYEQAAEIAETLTDDRLILNALIQPGLKGVSDTQRTLLMAQTKGLLFDKIDRMLREKYLDKMPVVYSVPIVNMDWEQADQLKSQTEKI